METQTKGTLQPRGVQRDYRAYPKTQSHFSCVEMLIRYCGFKRAGNPAVKLDGFMSEGKVISIELFICSNDPQTRENGGTCACRNMCGRVVSV